MANNLAKENMFRAVTHNKGILNGITAIALATGQDTRAIESNIHAFSILKYKKYRALTDYFLTQNNTLRGELEIPLSLGFKGGATNNNNIYQLNFKIMNIKDNKEFGSVVASLGLA